MHLWTRGRTAWRVGRFNGGVTDPAGQLLGWLINNHT